MKNTYVLIALLIFLSPLWELTIGQEYTLPLSFVSEEIEYLRTESYPAASPKRVYKNENRFIVFPAFSTKDFYKITAIIQVKCTDCVFSEPFVIKTIDNHGREINHFFNDDCYAMFPNEFYSIQLEISFDSVEYITLLLGQIDTATGIFYYDKFSTLKPESTFYLSVLK